MIDFGSISYLDYVLIISGILIILYFYFTKEFGFFKNKGVEYERPYPIFGSLAKMIFQITDIYEFTKILYQRSKKHGFSGFFEQNRPILVLGSPELIKLATVKDFDYFTDHRTIIASKVLEKNLVSLKGQEWRNMRNTLSPAFTASKLRYMFELIDKCGQQIDKFLLKECEKRKEQGEKNIVIDQEMKELFTRFTNDAIATSAFGFEIDSLADPNNYFFLMGKDITDLASGFRWVKSLVALFSPFLFKHLFNGEFFSKKAFNFFDNLVRDNLEKRRKEKIIRPDMIHLLMEAQSNKSNPNELSDEDIVAQAIIFFFAGFETISTTLAIAAHQIAEFPEVQDKLIEEIDKKLEENEGKITYDILMKEMPYMNMVLDETQRRIPAAPATERVCTKRYTFPSGENHPEYTIYPGQQIWVPIYGLHRDPDYFPEPDKLIPERWEDESKHNLNIFMPFGVGPRMCIANRFAKMESKLALFYILKNFKMVFTDKTKNPPKFLSQGLTIQNKHGYWLGLKPRH